MSERRARQQARQQVRRRKDNARAAKHQQRQQDIPGATYDEAWPAEVGLGDVIRQPAAALQSGRYTSSPGWGATAAAALTSVARKAGPRRTGRRGG